MNEPLLIGARGWEHDAWLENFYPAAKAAQEARIIADLMGV